MKDHEFGSDGQVHEVDRPEVTAPPAAPAPADPFEAAEPASAAQRLRAFEDEHLPDAPRHNGQLERGHGSLFQRLPADKQKAHGKLEKAVSAEQKVAEARTALAAAEAACRAAAEDASRFGG